MAGTRAITGSASTRPQMKAVCAVIETVRSHAFGVKTMIRPLVATTIAIANADAAPPATICVAARTANPSAAHRPLETKAKGMPGPIAAANVKMPAKPASADILAANTTGR